jgi:hypothetical protein
MDVGVDVGMDQMDLGIRCLIRSPQVRIRMSSHCTRILVRYVFFSGCLITGGITYGRTRGITYGISGLIFDS